MSYEGFLQVALAKGVGNVTLKKIIVFLQEQSLSWNDLCCDDSLLNYVFNYKESIVQAIKNQGEHAKRISEKLHKKNIGIIYYQDPQYPKKLKKSLGEKCPAFLFYKGNIDLLNKKSVGFCGSRKASSKGLSITANCAQQLAKRDIVVVSGYAAGTDIAAHKSALQHSGGTIFVLAEGILRLSIKNEIKDFLTEKNHLFLSQYMPELTWNVGNAMKRNSVIIGLSSAMILVESGKSGGTFAAGNETLAMGRPLFVIDFAQHEVSAEANPYFIERGGIPIRGKSGIPYLARVFSAIEDRNTIKELSHLILSN
ncbi:MAG: DNA-binding protein [Thermoanaerobacteraceae bacterium]|nr:DNA-binding protein [Thermoanaerobacteraceae bacterium]